MPVVGTGGQAAVETARQTAPGPTDPTCRTDVDTEVAWLAEVVPGVDSPVGLVMVQTFEVRAFRAWLNVLTGLPLADRPCAMPMSSGLCTALVGEIRRLYVPRGPEPVSRG